MKEAAKLLELQEVVETLESSLKLDAGSLAHFKVNYSNADDFHASESHPSDLQFDSLHYEDTKEAVLQSK